MKKTEKIAFVKIEFYGLYEWGKGWESTEQLLQWKKFWNERGKGYWSYFIDNKMTDGSEYIVSTIGSAYLHPMGFDMTLTSCGLANTFECALFTLHKLCSECANACGGTFKMFVTERTIDVELEEYNNYE